MTVLMHDRLEKSLAHLLANKLSSETLLATQLTRLFMEAYEVGACTFGGLSRREQRPGSGLRELSCWPRSWRACSRMEARGQKGEGRGSPAYARECIVV